jgi:hypothetical protein
MPHAPRVQVLLQPGDLIVMHGEARCGAWPGGGDGGCRRCRPQGAGPACMPPPSSSITPTPHPPPTHARTPRTHAQVPLAARHRGRGGGGAGRGARGPRRARLPHAAPPVRRHRADGDVRGRAGGVARALARPWRSSCSPFIPCPGYMVVSSRLPPTFNTLDRDQPLPRRPRPPRPRPPRPRPPRPRPPSPPPARQWSSSPGPGHASAISPSDP